MHENATTSPVPQPSSGRSVTPDDRTGLHEYGSHLTRRLTPRRFAEPVLYLNGSPGDSKVRHAASREY